MTDYCHLRVKAGDLVEALDFNFSEAEWFLDLKTGEVLFSSVDEPLELDGEGDADEDFNYLPIPPLESFRSFQIMEAFLDELPEGRPKKTLSAALSHRKPFRSFKDALLNFPDLREAWFRFRDAAMLDIAREWLEDNAPGARFVED